MTAIHRFPVLIPDTAIDANGHANNVEYVHWMQRAAMSHSDFAGCTTATKAAGGSWVIRQPSCRVPSALVRRGQTSHPHLGLNAEESQLT
jgi:acyl-CoA thioesterase FadM